MFRNIEVMGRLTVTPELKYTPQGTAYTQFAVASERNYKTSTGEKITDFYNCTAWNKTAEFATKYLEKGQLCVVTGDPLLEQYTDRNGENRKTFNIKVERIPWSEYRDKEKYQPNPEQYGISEPAKSVEPDNIPDGFAMVEDEDIPF